LKLGFTAASLLLFISLPFVRPYLLPFMKKIEKENRFTMSLGLVALVAEDAEERQEICLPAGSSRKRFSPGG
jgi:hypothetical protein